MTAVSGNIKRPDIRGGSSRWGRQTLRLSTTAIFGHLGGYFFGNVTDKETNIPVLDWKMNNLEWPWVSKCNVSEEVATQIAQKFHVKIRFRPTLLDSEHLTFKNNCVKSNKHRTMSSVAEMLVNDSTVSSIINNSRYLKVFLRLLLCPIYTKAVAR